MTRTYFTLCTWEKAEDATATTDQWADQFGSYDRAEVQGEIEFAYDHLPKAHVKIIAHDGTAAAMMKARDELPAPKGRKQ